MVPLVKDTNGTTMWGMFGGGKSAGGSMTFEYNSESPASLGTRGLLTFANDANTAGSIFTIGNHGTTEDALVNMNDNGNDAKAALNAIVSALRTGEFTKAEKLSLIGAVEYLDTALGDKNKVGMIVKVPAEVLKHFKGSENNPTWADNDKLASEGIGVYVDRRTAKNAFTEAFAAKPYDKIVNFKPVTLDAPNGGKITILPRSADGTITVRGEVYSYKMDPSGKFVKIGRAHV